MKNGHLASEGREIRCAFAAPSVGWQQLCARAAPLRDHDLAPFSHLVEESREIPTGFANASGAHEVIVLRVAHGGNCEAFGAYAAPINRARVSAIGH